MFALTLLAAALAGPVQTPPAVLTVAVTGLRNAKGAIQICMTRDPAHFPDCGGDPHSVRRTVPATVAVVAFQNIEPGAYALSVIHDENYNGKLDTAFGVPREGFGFSRNPKIRFGPPRFADAVSTIVPGSSRLGIRMKYLV